MRGGDGREVREGMGRRGREEGEERGGRWRGEEGGLTIVVGNTLVKERRKNLISQIVHTSCPSKTVSPLAMYNL